MTKIDWERTVKNMRAVCANFRGEDHCRNCPNCAHFEKLEITDEFWLGIEKKIDNFTNSFKKELDTIRRVLKGLEKEELVVILEE